MNPRTPEGQCLSRASHSAALAPLLGAFSIARYHRRRNGGRADECTRLESGRPSRVRGFESPPFRQYIERLESVLRTRSPCKPAISGLNVEDCCLGEPTSLAVEVVKRPCLASGRAFCFPWVFGRKRDQYKLPASFRIWLKLGRPRPASQRLNRADRLRNNVGSLHHRRGRSSRQKHDCTYERNTRHERHTKAPPKPSKSVVALGDNPSALRQKTAPTTSHGSLVVLLLRACPALSGLHPHCVRVALEPSGTLM